MRRLASLMAAIAAVFCIAAASDPSERLSDPALEAKAREIFKEVRCLQCQSESIDDSNAPLAQTLRKIVRDQVTAGASEREIKTFLVDRYGEYVLLKPPFSAGNLVLWLAPLAVVLVGGAGLAMILRRRSTTTAPLSPEEEAKIARLMQDGA